MTSGKINIDILQRVLIKKLCQLISKRTLIKFYFESESGYKGWRPIEPYIVAIIKGQVKVVGLPIDELAKKDINDRYLGHYYLEKMTYQNLRC
jgi:hypothetical protein